jgi:hypothetical protein
LHKTVRPDDFFPRSMRSVGRQSVLINCNRKKRPTGRLKVVYQSMT